MIVDRNSPVNLHAQIAQQLRYKIATGQLQSGQKLPSAREAAEQWNVNFHTVRRAYRELADCGLLEIGGSKGTRVALLDATSRKEPISGFIDNVIARSYGEHGLTINDLIMHLQHRRSDAKSSRIRATVIECNRIQTEELRQQLIREYDIEVEQYVLGKNRGVPRGTLIGTIFHKAELLKRWPGKKHCFNFLPIELDHEFVGRFDQILDTCVRSCVVIEHEPGVARSIASDIQKRTRKSPEISIGLTTKNGRIPRTLVNENSLCLVAPRIWESIPKRQRSSANVIRIEYQFSSAHLGSLASRMGWTTSKENCGAAVCGEMKI